MAGVEAGVVNVLLVQDKERVKETRLALDSAGYYDDSRRISRAGKGYFALPITPTAVRALAPSTHNQKLCKTAYRPETVYFNGSSYTLTHAELQPSKREVARAKTDHKTLRSSIEQVLSQLEPPMSREKCEKLLCEVPTSWVRHGDLVVLPARAFNSEDWRRIISNLPNFWNTVAVSLSCARLARDAEIACDGHRASRAVMLRGTDPWVQHIDNGIKYVFDVTAVMFSSGNIEEKLRVARFDCHGETVVDMYAGIGYFTLPYLVHARAETVHACEWNKLAVEGLRRGLVANGVEEKCIIHVGDCRKVCPRGVADRVNLGLIPTSEGGWATGCAALRSDRGGWLHIHGNVSWRPRGTFCVPSCNPWEDGEIGEGGEGRRGVICGVGEEGEGRREEICEVGEEGEGRSEICEVVEEDEGRRGVICEVGEEGEGRRGELRREARENWKCYILEKIGLLLSEGNPLSDGWIWDVKVGRVGMVKSYAPCVDHLVADVECRPVPSDVECRPVPSDVECRPVPSDVECRPVLSTDSA